MGDGTGQRGFPFRVGSISRLRPGEIVVDLFAGGGGASEALRQALGRDPDIAINHDEWAIGMHAANHPMTRHLQDDVWHADPVREVAGRAVGWFHASPDCTHFSQAKGGQPRSRATRSLSWVVLKWAGSLARAGHAPRIISLENVEQILKWGPLVAKRCKTTGRVVTLDMIPLVDPKSGNVVKRGGRPVMVNRVADRGERVSVWNQCLIPDKRHAGRTWAQFVTALCVLGYAVEWRSLVACDYGAGTSRKRLFLIARRDGVAITWPAATHGNGAGLAPFVTAADCIDFTVPCPSIFERKKPLADATQRRIARGIKRYVFDAAEPFIVQCANASANGVAPASAPLGTITAWPRGGSHAVVAPTLVQTAHGDGHGTTKWRGGGDHGPRQPMPTIDRTGNSVGVAAATLVQAGYGERAGQAPRVPGLHKPVGTLVDGQKHALVTAFLEQAAGGPNSNTSPPRSALEPVSTITVAGSQQRLATANLVTMRRNVRGQRPDDPLSTICAGAVHHGVVECTLSPEDEAGALRVAAFLIKYYGTALGVDIATPLDTITTRDRLALVTVVVKGTPYVIVDIGLRMLRREELFKAQGFPPDYIIDRTADGRPLSISRSVRMVGNSVSPPPLRALAQANLDAVHAKARAA